MNIAAMEEGTGMVIDHDGKRVAVAKVDGKLQSVSAICTHAGCEVAWNAQEKTWDCPCHQSVFSPDGDVLSGPAETPLKHITLPEEKS